MNIEIEGLEETVEMLNRASTLVQAEAQLKALSAAGNVIADELERNTPVRAEESGGGDSLDRGVLRENVMVAVTLDSKLRGGYADIGFGKFGFVAAWLEYGHRLVSHGMKSIRRVIGYVKPRPFMALAAQNAADKAIDTYAETLRAELQNAGIADKEDVA